MKHLFAIAIHLSWAVSGLFGQSSPNFKVILEELPIPNLPGLQAYVIGESEGIWLVIGGRKDGLHRRQPFAAFDAAGMNNNVYVLDPVSQNVWSKPLNTLPISMVEQLQSTNMEFRQVGNTLYIVGGYGYSNTAGDHITYPYLTAVNVPGVIEAVINNQPLIPHFRQLQDARVQVTGGYLDALDDYFYLAGGQKFIGRYNPMGPNHGPGFIQEYTNEVRRFKIADDGITLALTNYEAWKDTQNLHRRDYNMAPQIFPDGTYGFTMFSGVFRYDQDLPWLNTVDVASTGFSVNNSFNQHLNQYHTAHLPIYSAAENQMHTIFFGGISQFYVDDVTGFLIEDPNVPFVKTISMVTRFADGQMAEVKIGEMPYLTGASAEFIPRSDAPRYENGVIRLDDLDSDTTFVGYILGGIQSSQPNIFFINTGAESVAANRLFKVFFVQSAASATKFVEQNPLHVSAIPNPFRNEVQISFETTSRQQIGIQIFDASGKRVLKMSEQEYQAGKHQVPVTLKWFPKGTYNIVLSEQSKIIANCQIIKQ
ncbi:MAG: T9SS type A sorting domain-containing protein [Saprospiraceae bacterium]|nr:T9SS type A sorting domain-containing protein [Saprospiraceae bacterium]